MRQIISIALALVIASLPLSSAYADDYRRYNQDEELARALAVLGVAVTAGVIISLATTPNEEPRDSWDRWDDDDWSYQPRRSDRWQAGQRQQPHYNDGPPNRGTWVEKFPYEQSGRDCPGPIDYWDGTYWCRVR